MIKVSILYAPESAENKKSAEEIAGLLDAERCSASVKKARDSALADITGVDVILFGVLKSDSSDVQEEFRDYARIFRGINLAGKTAAFFSFGGDKASAPLRKALKSTDISVIEAELSLMEKSPARASDIREWVKQVMSAHQGKANGAR